MVFAYFNIVFYNFSIGTLSYTIASEMAVGRNRNKITSCALGTFFFTVWLMVFTSPYLYYDAELGPMVGFVYAGTTLITLAYSWFCVGETTGRTNAELERFFIEGIPVRKWKTHVFEPLPPTEQRGEEDLEDDEVVLEKDRKMGVAAQVEEKV